ncbi:hypothetical protein GCM10010103_76650 [Streptomyces paradoxus]
MSCCEAEFGISRPLAYRLLDVARALAAFPFRGGGIGPLIPPGQPDAKPGAHERCYCGGGGADADYRRDRVDQDASGVRDCTYCQVT